MQLQWIIGFALLIVRSIFHRYIKLSKSKANDPLQLHAGFMNGASGRFKRPDALNDQLILPAKSSNFAWVFSIQNSFDWNFGKRNLSAGAWQLLLFGTLLFFFIMIFASSWLKPGNKLSLDMAVADLRYDGLAYYPFLFILEIQKVFPRMKALIFHRSSN